MKATIKFPHGLMGFNGHGAWTEQTSTNLQMNAAGEKIGFLRWVDGELESVSLVLGAFTQADNVQLTIQNINNAGDTISVTGNPDGTPIANSTVNVANVGGALARVTWTFGATKPSTPAGYYWFVFEASSAGAFDIRPVYVLDWMDDSENQQENVQKVYSGSWGAPVLAGVHLSLKYTDSTYERANMLSSPAIAAVDWTLSSHSVSGTSVTGFKWTADASYVLTAVSLPFFSNTAYSNFEVVMINSSNTVLARVLIPGTNCISSGLQRRVALPRVGVTAGDSYRIYVKNALEGTDAVALHNWTPPSGGAETIGMDSIMFCKTTATDPVSEGGAGAWTDTSTILVPAWMEAELDFTTISTTIGAGLHPIESQI